MDGRVFGLDPQFLVDAGIMAIAMLVLYTLLSFLLFNPVRDFLKKRKEYVENNIMTEYEKKFVKLGVKKKQQNLRKNI